MAFGLEIRNQYNKLTLSESLPLVKFIGKCAFNRAIGGTSKLLIYNSPIIPNGGIPKVFLYFDIGTETVFSGITSIGGGVWEISFYCNPVDSRPQLYCFSSAPISQSSDTHGMRIYNSDSSLIFDSGWSGKTILKVQEIHNTTSGGSYSFATTIAKPGIYFRNATTDVWYQGPYADGNYWNYIGHLAMKRNTATDFLGEGLICYSIYSSTGYSASTKDYNDILIPVIDCSLYD